jgi:hypothetical protein
MISKFFFTYNLEIVDGATSQRKSKRINIQGKKGKPSILPDCCAGAFP